MNTAMTLLKMDFTSVTNLIYILTFFFFFFLRNSAQVSFLLNLFVFGLYVRFL